MVDQSRNCTLCTTEAGCNPRLDVRAQPRGDEIKLGAFGAAGFGFDVLHRLEVRAEQFKKGGGLTALERLW